MKITPLFGVVLTIHAVVIGLLVFQPGCQTTPKEGPGPDDTMVTDSTDSGRSSSESSVASTSKPKEPISDAAMLDDAYNAGFETDRVQSDGRGDGDASGSLSGGREKPMRPTRPRTGENASYLKDTLPETDRDTVALESEDIRYDNYTVQPGDSLWKIAGDYDVELDALLEANDLTKDSIIKVGQVLLVPLDAPDLAPVQTEDESLSGRSIEVDTMKYTVQRGDTLSGIARTFGTTVNEIRKLNNKSGDVIRVGETLIVPGREEAAGENDDETYTPKDESREKTSATSGNTTNHTHTVRPGENPSMIASRYGMSTEGLIRLNGNFDPRRLRVGQVLKIDPVPGKEPGDEDSSGRESRGSNDNRQAASQPETRESESPQPVRIRVTEPEPDEGEVDFDPSIFLDDAEEIPVLRVEENSE